MSRPVSKTHRPMSLHDRAAQFSPYAALTGYSDEISEKGRYTDDVPTLTEDAARELDEKLGIIAQNAAARPAVTVTRFIKDELKSGGRYEKSVVCVRRVDMVERILITDKNERIPIDVIVEITGEIFKNAQNTKA